MSDVAAESSSNLLLCTSCCYDLRGLELSGKCPECGKSIALSSSGDLIGLANAKWRRRLSVGAMLLAATFFISGILNGLVVYQLINSPGWIYWPSFLTPQVQELLSIIADVFGFVGIWWLTFPDPLRTPYGRSLNLLIVLRIIAVANIVSIVGFRLIGELIPLRLKIDWGLAFLAPVAVQGFLLFALLSRLSRRLPDTRLAARFSILKWLKPIAYICAAGGELLPFVIAKYDYDFRRLLPVPGYALGAALGIWAAWLLIWFTRGLFRCQMTARGSEAIRETIQPAPLH